MYAKRMHLSAAPQVATAVAVAVAAALDISLLTQIRGDFSYVSSDVIDLSHPFLGLFEFLCTRSSQARCLFSCFEVPVTDFSVTARGKHLVSVCLFTRSVQRHRVYARSVCNAVCE